MRIHWFRSVLLIAAAGIAVAAWSPVGPVTSSSISGKLWIFPWWGRFSMG